MRVKTKPVKNKSLTWGQKKKIKRARNIVIQPEGVQLFGGGRKPVAQIRRR